MNTFSRAQDSLNLHLCRAAQLCQGYNKRLWWNFHLYLGWFEPAEWDGCFVLALFKAPGITDICDEVMAMC